MSTDLLARLVVSAVERAAHEMVEDFLNQLRVRSLSLKTLVCPIDYRNSSQGFYAPQGHKSNLLSKILDLSNPLILVGPTVIAAFTVLSQESDCLAGQPKSSSISLL